VVLLLDNEDEAAAFLNQLKATKIKTTTNKTRTAQAEPDEAVHKSVEGATHVDEEALGEVTPMFKLPASLNRTTAIVLAAADRIALVAAEER
jgi:hypothetical protein